MQDNRYIVRATKLNKGYATIKRATLAEKLKRVIKLTKGGK